MAGRHIDSLEQALKARLLQRTTRRPHVTDVGRAYYQRSRRILEEFEEAQREAAVRGAVASSGCLIRVQQESLTSAGVSSLSSAQQPTTSPLRSFTVVQVAHPKLCCRLDFQAGSTSSIYATPHSLTDLCADELLLELPRVPASDRNTVLLNVDDELQGIVDKPR